jgi:hypothetical protein
MTNVLFVTSQNIEPLYPKGKKFTLGLYSVYKDFNQINSNHWNNATIYRYYTHPDFDSIISFTKIHGWKGHDNTIIPKIYYDSCLYYNLSCPGKLNHGIDSIYVNDKDYHLLEKLEYDISKSIYILRNIHMKNPEDVFDSISANTLIIKRRILDSMQTIKDINQNNKMKNLSYWALPEELRFYREEEREILTKYTSLIKRIDTIDRKPIFMYIPGHLPKERIKKYTKYLDILSASCYPEYQYQHFNHDSINRGVPHSYVRWSIERTKEAITDSSKFVLGDKYQNNEKTIFAVLEMFKKDENHIITKEGIWHDFWLSIACDVKGILVNSHHYGGDFAFRKHHTQYHHLQEPWTTLNKAVNIFIQNDIDKVIIEGTNIEFISPRIIEGSEKTKLFYFQPMKNMEAVPIQYNSIKLLVKSWKDYTYIIAVNSNEQDTVHYQIPIGLTNQVENLLNEKIEITNMIEDNLKPLGVSIYRYKNLSLPKYD